MVAELGIAALVTGCASSTPAHSSAAPSNPAATSPTPSTPAAAPTPTSAANGLDAYWFTSTNLLTQDKSNGWQMDASAPQDPSGTGLDREGQAQYTYQIGAANVKIWGPDDSLTATNVTDNMTLALAKESAKPTVAPTSIAVAGGLPAEFAQATASDGTIIAVVILQDSKDRFYEAFLQTDPTSESVAFPAFQQIIQSVSFEDR